jgi:hypothetical protein
MHHSSLIRSRFFRPLRSALLVTACLAALTPSARAWNATGHMTITAIAEARLSDEAKKNV